MTTDTELMDQLENIAIAAMKPVVAYVLESIESDTDLEIATRNLLGKVGTRILFGKEIYDAAAKRTK